jgi:FKBP-type peptidyl-prolyl cis-trans isomerase
MRSRISYPAPILIFLAAAGALALPSLAEPGRSQTQIAAAREVVTSSGLRYADLKVGQGEEAVPGKIVEVQYTGRLKDGTPFDTCRERGLPFTFRLGAGDAIKGWDQGLIGMKVGGKRRLVIPPELGFGKKGVGGVVPPDAVLFYEFELLAVR